MNSFERKYTEIWENRKSEINQNLKTNKIKFTREKKLLMFFYSIIVGLSLMSYLFPLFLDIQIYLILISTIIYFIVWFKADHLFPRHDTYLGTISDIFKVDEIMSSKILILITYMLGYSYLFTFKLVETKDEPTFTRNTFVLLLAFLAALRLMPILILS